MSKHIPMQWTADECTDANDFVTIRPADGSPNGDTDADPIATVYDEEHAGLVAAAPALLAMLKRVLNARPLPDDLRRISDATIAAYDAAEALIATVEGRTNG